MVVAPSDRKNRLFDCRPEAGNRDLQREPLRDLRVHLQTLGFALDTLDHWSDLDRVDLVLFHVRDRATLRECLRRGLGSRTTYLAWEPPVVQPLHSPVGLDRLSSWFGRILTWDEHLLGDERYLRLRYPHALGPAEPSPRAFHERSLLANISANKTSLHPLELYSARRAVAERFDREEPSFELWGPGWETAGLRSWKGCADSKREVYHGVRFALCFENMRDARGYATEKPFDALRWGTVPVYWGDEILTSLLPRESFVDYPALGSPEALLEHLRSWTPERHEAAVAAGRTFLESPAAQAWSARTFADEIARAADLAEIRPREPRPMLKDLLAMDLAWCRARLRKEHDRC